MAFDLGTSLSLLARRRVLVKSPTTRASLLLLKHAAAPLGYLAVITGGLAAVQCPLEVAPAVFVAYPCGMVINFDMPHIGERRPPLSLYTWDVLRSLAV